MLVVTTSHDSETAAFFDRTLQLNTALMSSIATDEACLQAMVVCESHKENEQAVFAILVVGVLEVKLKFEPHIDTMDEPIKSRFNL